MNVYQIVERDTDLPELQLYCRCAQALKLPTDDAYGESNPYRTVLRNLSPAFFYGGRVVPAAKASVAYLWDRADQYDERGF